MSRERTRERKRKLPSGFGKRLEQALFDSGLSAWYIEKTYNVNHGNIYQYISETMTPNTYNLYVLCVALNVSADYLLGLEK